MSTTPSTTPSAARSITRLVTAHRQTEGGGFVVRRPVPTHGLDLVDPFLLIDEMGPVVYAPGEAVGAPDHPHRGFETVTYVLQGDVVHKDSAGNTGRIGPGDIQWMTAGAGVVHSEMPSEQLRRTGGPMHGFQIWVNLPAKDKMSPPRYQDLRGTELPRVTTDDGLADVVIVAGEALGHAGKAATHTPIQYLDWTLRPGARVQVDVPADHNALVYVFEGEATVAGRPVADGQCAVLGEGDHVVIGAPTDADPNQPARALLLSGAPIDEPVARYGPFVMNTFGEIRQAMADYQAGRMGRIEV